MQTLDALVAEARAQTSPQIEASLRGLLSVKEPGWLIDQLVRLSLGVGGLPEVTTPTRSEERQRSERAARVKSIGVDAAMLADFINRYEKVDRALLIEEQMLRSDAPQKGTTMIPESCRDIAGSRLLRFAKDVMFAVLFGDESIGVSLRRSHRELLTLTVPRAKASCLCFLKAATEFSASGTWQDPSGVSSDARADNIILEVEYGEIDEELVGTAIIRCLSLINTLEVNEQILYARMINVEESSLIA